MNEINLNEVNSAEALALLGQIETNNTVIQEPIDMLAEQEVATVGL